VGVVTLVKAVPERPVLYLPPCPMPFVRRERAVALWVHTIMTRRADKTLTATCCALGINP
jgi:hypothetical protein